MFAEIKRNDIRRFGRHKIHLNADELDEDYLSYSEFADKTINSRCQNEKVISSERKERANECGEETDWKMRKEKVRNEK